MSTDNQPPTQVKRPWRSVLRTVIVAALALLPTLPDVAEAAGLSEIPSVVTMLGVAAAVQRVLTIPAVDKWLDHYIPWLAADPYQGNHRK